MILAGALEKFKTLELKMSEVYLWCSISFEELELRQFFADMSDEELSHARALENIGRLPAIKDVNFDIRTIFRSGSGRTWPRSSFG